MVCVSGFEAGCGQSSVRFGCIAAGYCCTVDNVFGEALTVQRALCIFWAVAFLLELGAYAVPQQFLVVSLDYGSHVRHAAVRNLDGIPIKNLAEFIINRETLIYYIQKFFADICFDVVIVRGVIPNNIAFSVCFRLIRFLVV